MRHAPILLLLIAVPALTACGGLKTSGGVRAAHPDATVTAPCDTPEQHLRGGDWEVIAGRLGLALIDCGEKQAELVRYMGDISGALQFGGGR
jgi:hypothetical protein